MEPADPAGRVDPGWAVTVDADARLERVAEALCSLADGRFGTRGAREEDGAGSVPLTLAAGIYQDAGGGPTLLPGPVWTGLDVAPRTARTAASWTCALECYGGPGGPVMAPSCAACGSRPWPALGWSGCGPRARPTSCAPARRCWLLVTGSTSRRAAAATSAGPAPGPLAVAASPPPPANAPQTTTGPGWWTAWPSTWPNRTTRRRRMRPWSNWARWRGSASTGCWPSTGRVGGRWADAEVTIEGDPDAELAVRFALFHLLASAAADGEAAVGARGLTGPATAATSSGTPTCSCCRCWPPSHPPAARAMLEYRIRRLRRPGARAARGLAGARFPWESAADGTEVTPMSATRPAGAPRADPHRAAGGAHRGRRGLGGLPLRRLDRRQRASWTAPAGPAAGEGPLLGVPGPLGRGRPGPHRRGHRPRRVPRARSTTTPSPT